MVLYAALTLAALLNRAILSRLASLHSPARFIICLTASRLLSLSATTAPSRSHGTHSPAFPSGPHRAPAPTGSLTALPHHASGKESVPPRAPRYNTFRRYTSTATARPAPSSSSGYPVLAAVATRARHPSAPPA